MISAPSLSDPAPLARAASAPPRRNADGPRRGGRVLGLAWLHGFFSAAVFHEQAAIRRWTAPEPVRSLEDFSAALDAALAELAFDGSETFLILEHEQLVHRTDSAPGFSEKTARSYLRARVARFAREEGPLIWCSQRTLSTRRDASYVLHLLPTGFYEALHRAFLARHLDLDRIFPLVVPLQLELDSVGSKEQSALVAAEIGGTTTIVVGKNGGQLAFARTFLASWRTEAVRVGVEVNRSMLYAKQQWGVVPERLRLFGDEQAFAEVRNRCGEGKDIATRPARIAEWLQAAGALPAHHPVNVLSAHLGAKRRRRWLHRACAAACWVALGLLALALWSQAEGRRAEESRFEHLRSRSRSLESERERLQARNGDADRNRELLRQAADRRLPPVPSRLLADVTAALPKEIRLSEFRAQFDGSEWSFRLVGSIEADEDSAHAILALVQQRLAQGQWHPRFTDTGANLTAFAPDAAGGAPGSFGFSMGGVLLEK